MTLSFYIARRFLWWFALVFAVFFAIMYLIDMVEQVRRFGAGDFGLSDAARLALLNVPGSLYRILPLVTILAAIALCLGLARSSELVVTRAAGRSGLRLIAAPVLSALAVGMLAVAAFNPIVAATAKRYDAEVDRFRTGDGSVISVSREGLWLRQGTAGGQTVIRAAQSNLDATVLYGVTFIAFGTDGSPESRIEGERAELLDGVWRITAAKEWQLGADENPELSSRVLAEKNLPTDLTPDQIRDGFGTPSIIPVWDLPSFIAGLSRAGYSARKHQVWFQMELALPLLLASMVLVGAGFTMRHARFGRTGILVLLAILAGFAIFFLRNFAQVLGENGQIPVAIAAWSPPVAAILASVGLLLHLEDG
jgi:lipopolysaccharide export system permease protein